MQDIVQLSLVCILAAAVTGGCASPPEQQRTESRTEYQLVVAEDQSITLDGRATTIGEFVQMIEDRTPDKHVVIKILPESKIQQETLQDIVTRLQNDGYTTTVEVPPDRIPQPE